MFDHRVTSHRSVFRCDAYSSLVNGPQILLGNLHVVETATAAKYRRPLRLKPLFRPYQLPFTGKDWVPYYPALKRLMAAGATLQQAQKVLNAYYPKGVVKDPKTGQVFNPGRPWVSLQGRLALERSGMPLAHPMDAPTARQKSWLQQHGLWSD